MSADTSSQRMTGQNTLRAHGTGRSRATSLELARRITVLRGEAVLNSTQFGRKRPNAAVVERPLQMPNPRRDKMKNLFRSLMACFLFGAAASPVLAQGDNTGIYLGIWANPLGLHPISEDKEEQAIELREGGAPLGINRTFALHLHYYGWTALAPLLDNNGVFHPDAALQFD